MNLIRPFKYPPVPLPPGINDYVQSVRSAPSSDAKTNPIMILRHAACEALSRIDDPDIRVAIAALIAKCDEALEKVV